MTYQGCIIRASTLLGVADAGNGVARVYLGCRVSLSAEHGLVSRVARASALGRDADRIHVARLATHVRGLDLAFPRAGTSVTRPAILSVLASVPSISPLCGSATGAVNPTTRRAPRAHELTLEGASCGARRHREPPDDQGDNTPVDGKTWSHP